MQTFREFLADRRGELCFEQAMWAGPRRMVVGEPHNDEPIHVKRERAQENLAAARRELLHDPVLGLQSTFDNALLQLILTFGRLRSGHS